jgi:hypothetical protein
MTIKATKSWYWTLTIIVCLFMFLDGIASLPRSQSAVILFASLGYPAYLITITGVAKIIGAIAVIQDKYPTLKEWAYSGFVIDFIGAGASFLFAHQGVSSTIFPIILIAITLGSHYFWKKLMVAKKSSIVAA